MSEKNPPKKRPGYRPIFRAWKTLLDGTRDYAKNHGKKCWVIWIKVA